MKKGRYQKRLELQNTNRPIDVIKHWIDNDYLELNPPYQRGDVWGPVRRKNLIRSIQLGIPIPSIVINDRFHAGWGLEGKIVVIDGKQRVTTIGMFLKDELTVPGAWFGIDAPSVKFSELPKPEQRHLSFCSLPFSEGTLKTLEDEQKVFELVNFGGVPQGESDNE